MQDWSRYHLVTVQSMINNFLEEGDYQPSHRVYTHPRWQHHIYIGDIQSALDLPFIESHNIGTVVTAATGLEHVHFDPPIQHIVYPLLDSKSQSISTLFAQFYDLVEVALEQSSLLVHCAAGISRSSTLVIAYLMKQHSWGFKQAIAFVRESRPCVLPNLGFQRQLKEYEGQLRHKKEGEGHRKESEGHKKEFGQEQRRPVRPLERRTGSKTSEERKHSSLNSKQSGLPEIGYLGQLKPKLFDMFAQQNERQVSQRIKRASHQKPRPDLEFYGTRRAAFKPLKSKSLIDKAPMLGNALAHEPYPRMKASMPIGRIEEVMARRLHLEGGKKSGTERQLRMKPLHRLAFPE